MTYDEHLLKQVEEECCEVAQRVSKAMRFGLLEVQPGQDLNNAERIVQELNDLMAAVDLCQRRGLFSFTPNASEIDQKIRKIEKYLKYAKKCGTLKG